MFIERVQEKFSANEPIFTEELISLFPEYSRVQVFRFINGAKKENALVQYDKGIYFMPRVTKIGFSMITADAVAKKKYLSCREKVYGVIGGIGLQNSFSITAQVPATIEIVTNNEATRGREIFIKNRRFLIKKSRVEINADNVAAYTVLQLFDDFGTETRLDDNAQRRVLEYLKARRVTKNELLQIAIYFPSRTLKKLIGSGILNEIA